MTFAKWPDDIHTTADQIKRIASAKSSKTTPSNIDKHTMTGCFPGSGSTAYTTSLESCTCGDFVRRKLPCKHIYRLAIELGLLNETAQSGVNKNTLEAQQFSLKDAVSELENLNEECQKIVRDFLYQALYQNASEFPVLAENCNAGLLYCALLNQIEAPEIALQALKRNQILQILDAHSVTGFKRNMSLKNLISWCIDNVPDVWSVFPQIYVFRFVANFKTAQRRVYTYLLRKYDWETYYNEEMEEIRYPHGAKFEDFSITVSLSGTQQSGNPNVCHFPDDEVTKLLTLYGHNRCLNGFDISSQGHHD